MKKCFKVDCTGEVIRGKGEFGRCDRCGTIYRFDGTGYILEDHVQLEKYAAAKKFVITAKVMMKVRNVLEEYIEDIEKMPGCLRDLHAYRIRQVLYDLDSGLCLLKTSQKEKT